MATKKSGKSSKTAHVLNVLSGLSQDAGTEDTAAEAGAVQEAPPPKQPVRPPVVEVERANDEALAEAIRDSLAQDIEAELLEELAVEVEEEKEMESSPVVAAAEAEAEESVANDSQTAGMEQNTGAIIPPKPLHTSEMQIMFSPDPNERIGYVNVMQALVEEKAPKYIEMFGICSCPRCTADVKALALTTLPPKYAVMEKGDVIPMLTVYEGRFSTALTAQIIKACERVSSNPRHTGT